MMSCNWRFGCYFNRSISQWCSNVPLVFQNYSIVMVQICLFNLIDHIYPKECSVSIICVKFFISTFTTYFISYFSLHVFGLKNPNHPSPPKNQTKQKKATKHPHTKIPQKNPEQKPHRTPNITFLFSKVCF